MDYNAKYFRDSLPEWKKRKDPILSGIFYRPLSFYCASIATNFGISANAISYFSTALGITACLLFLLNSFAARLTGAILINIWLVLDCTDGNIARSVKKQPFGEFADGISSYILVGLLGITMGFSVYETGGILFEAGNPWIILLGSLASNSDTMMRLIYQKYKNTEKDMQEKGIIMVQGDARLDKNSVGNFRIRVEAELGIGGILPISILITTIVGALDIVVLYCMLYFVLSCIVSTIMLILKTKNVTLSKMEVKENETISKYFGTNL